jgi:hypothetical protein
MDALDLELSTTALESLRDATSPDQGTRVTAAVSLSRLFPWRWAAHAVRVSSHVLPPNKTPRRELDGKSRRMIVEYIGAAGIESEERKQPSGLQRYVPCSR